MARRYKVLWRPFFQRTFDEWFLHTAWFSPLNRGILEHERETEKWAWDYPHLPYYPYMHFCYRRPHSANEKRQYAASLVDNDTPLVRGKRKPINLADVYWDQAIPMSRSWKKKKVKKQWMINI